MTTIIINAFLSAIGAGLLTLIILCIKWLFRKMRADKKTIEAIAHDAYFRQCRYLLAKDAITEEELENHNYLYEAYKAQGLNSTGDKFNEMILEKKVLISVDPSVYNKLP